MGLPGLRLLERKFEGPIRLFELKKCALEKQIERQLREFEQTRGVGLDASPDALVVAQGNAESLGVAERATLKIGDWRPF